MELKRFKKLYKIYSQLPLDREVCETPEYYEYIEASNNNKECSDWELKKRIKKAGIDYKKYCCFKMAYRIIEFKRSKNKEETNFDCIITHTSKRKEFGIPIHDGGSSFIKINYCPWCGQKL